MNGRAYYNDVDPYAVEWLRNLEAEKLITSGRVDGRPIEAVRAADLVGFERCHFFAGIGIWERALELAEWPRDREIWTGSCPCQPFSGAGAREGFEDERHLWPVWSKLIRKRRPAVVVGEQVASADGFGWLDAVFADLEGMGYAVGASVLPVASVGAPHGRHRIFFVADARGAEWEGRARREGTGSGGAPGVGDLEAVHAQPSRAVSWSHEPRTIAATSAVVSCGASWRIWAAAISRVYEPGRAFE